MRTKAEIRTYLDGCVGHVIECPNNRALNGQCVSLIKALLSYIGAPNPWKARGNAKDYANGLLRDGIASTGDGWLRVCVSKEMGRPYGHVWIDLKNETNYESNGVKHLICTKGTRPIKQATQIVNLDKYVAPDPQPPEAGGRVEQHATFTANRDRYIRRSPSLQGEIAGTFTAGSSQKYDSYIDADGFRWVSWIGASGHRNYTAVRRLSDNKRYGVCK